MALTPAITIIPGCFCGCGDILLLVSPVVCPSTAAVINITEPGSAIIELPTPTIPPVLQLSELQLLVLDVGQIASDIISGEGLLL